MDRRHVSSTEGQAPGWTRGSPWAEGYHHPNFLLCNLSSINHPQTCPKEERRVEAGLRHLRLPLRSAWPLLRVRSRGRTQGRGPEGNRRQSSLQRVHGCPEHPSSPAQGGGTEWPQHPGPCWGSRGWWRGPEAAGEWARHRPPPASTLGLREADGRPSEPGEPLPTAGPSVRTPASSQAGRATAASSPQIRRQRPFCSGS